MGRNFVSFFLSSILHLLPIIYPILLVWIRILIRNTEPDPPRRCRIRIHFGSGITTLVSSQFCFGLELISEARGRECFRWGF